MPRNYLIPILIFGTSTPAAAQADPTAVQDAVRRIAISVRLAAEEYALGVVNGKVQAAAEVEEARLFLGEAKKGALGLDAAHWTGPRLDSLIGLVDRVAPPDSLTAGAERLVGQLTRQFGVTLEEAPLEPPTLARGELIYQARCASCHGERGAGDGPAGIGLDPKPAALTNAAVLAGSSPVDFYRRITVGVAGTGMASFESTLSSNDRWAVALYSSMLRLPTPSGRVPTSLAAFRATAALSDAALLDSLGAGATLAQVAAVRAATGGSIDFGAVFREVRRRADSASQLARAGRAEEARSVAISAYMAFEQLERTLRIRDPKLVTRLEATFAEMRDGTGQPGRVAGAREELARALDRAEGVLGKASTRVSLFVQSALILLREGVEAILVVGALIAFLAKLGANDRRREIHWGVLAAIGLSVLTAVLLETVFRLSPAHQEALEGATMIVATAMLFGVSYWLVSKMEVAKWNQFVRSRLSAALSGRSMLALSSVAFLAVYREGFETVLFYKALAVSAGGAGVAGPIALGIVAASLTLAALYLAINRFGVRLPLRPFFAITSGFLYLMAVVFAGKAVAELQEGGAVGSTAVAWMGRLPSLGVYPTVETMVAQALLVVLGAVGLVWVFVIEPRRAGPAVPVGGNPA